MSKIVVKNLLTQLVIITPALIQPDGTTKYSHVDIPPLGSVTITCDPSKGDLNPKKANKIITYTAA